MKRFLSYVLMASLMCAFLLHKLPAVNVKAEASVIASEKQRENTDAPIGLIYALGIVPERDDLSGTVSRGEFMSILASFMKLDIEQYSSEQTFNDVSADSEYSGAINILYQGGYICGDGNGNFRPNDAVTYIEVLAAVVNVIDYTMGQYSIIPYPNYHLMKAGDLEISLNKSINDGVTRGEIYLILEKALEAPYRVIEGVYDDSFILSNDNTTILAEIYETYTKKGVVTQNYMTALYDSNGLKEEKLIGIDGQTYFTTDYGIAQHLGEKIKFYFRRDGGDNTVVFHTETYGSDIVQIASDDLESYNNGVLKYIYNEKGKTKDIRISERANVIYNGVYYKKGYELQKTDFDIKAGSVKLIANEENVYATVLIESYEFEIFGHISANGEKLLLASSDKIYNFEDYEEVRFVRNGEKIDTAQIVQGEVLNILEDKQSRYVTFYVTGDSIEGTLNQRTESEDEIVYIIDNSEYTLSHSFSRICDKEPKIGSTKVFLLNMFGDIVGLEKEDGGVGRYGILLDIADGDIRSIGYVKFINSKNRIKVYEITKKTVINGKKYKTREEFKWFADNKETLKGKLVTFDNNSDGELTKLCIETVDGYEEEIERKIEKKSMRYRSVGAFFGNAEVGVRDTTSIFIVSDTINSEEDCRNITMSEIGNDRTYTISAYNYNEYNVADVILLHQDASTHTVFSDSAVFVLEKLLGGFNKDGEDVYKLKGMTDGKESQNKYWFRQGDANFNVSDFKPGSLFLIKTNSAGEILATEVLHTHNPQNVQLEYSSSSAWGKILGKVVRISDDSCLINVSNTNEEDLRILKPAGSVYVYDGLTKEVRAGSVTDIYPGCTIFVRERNQEPKTIVIYEE